MSLNNCITSGSILRRYNRVSKHLTVAMIIGQKSRSSLVILCLFLKVSTGFNHPKLCIFNQKKQRFSLFAWFLSLSHINPLSLCVNLCQSTKISNIVSSICFIELLTELESVGGIGDDGGDGDIMRKPSFVCMV